MDESIASSHPLQKPASSREIQECLPAQRQRPRFPENDAEDEMLDAGGSGSKPANSPKPAPAPNPRRSQSAGLGQVWTMMAPIERLNMPYGTPTISAPRAAKISAFTADWRMP